MPNQIVQVIVSLPATAEENMDKDRALFEGLKKGEIPPTLRFYSWSEEAVTVGRGARPSGYEGGKVIVRPTGGGIVHHQTQDEITIALTHYRNPQEPILELYKKIHTSFIEALNTFGSNAQIYRPQNKPTANHQPNYCFVNPSPYDIMIDGVKVMGGALRVGKGCFLYQGTLKLANLKREEFLKAFLSNETFKNTWGRGAEKI